MDITVRMFASYADAIGADHATISLPERATVRDVRAAVARLSRSLPPNPIVAVNDKYATDDVAVGPGDEVAIIPPVAGG
jgi:molybdopterin converting factor subunit 1